MQLATGSRIGPYEILDHIGAGGMGEVYRARDSKLDRLAAIKVLPELFVQDPERRARFEREARALASLNHPHIAQIYGVEDSTGTPAIAMEFVDGEDLATRIARGPIPWPEALPIARQLAGALDAAHERGVIHRDLKPANIMLTADGSVKVLDFGLAKAVAAADLSPIDPRNSPTFTSPATQLGIIVGTAAYMAPEQAKGKAVDKRVDIWAFGCVLYEMLTGRSPFGSDSVAESIGLVVTREPDWTLIPPAVPAGVVQLLKRCLGKDPKQRLRDIGEAAILLATPDAFEARGAVAAPPALSRRARLMMAAAAVALTLGGAAAAWFVKSAPEIPLRRLELPPPVAEASHLALAPDGRSIAYISEGHLYVRDMENTSPRDLGSVPPASQWVFWSPDSRQIGFVGEATIRVVPAAGGPAFTVCRLPGTGRVMGIAWRPDQTIVFSAWRDSLYQVPASGGTPAVLLAITPESEVDFHSVATLPDRRLIVSVHTRNGDTDLFEILEDGQRTRLTADTSLRRMRYVDPGYLLFLRTGANDGLWALPWGDGPFDLARAVRLEAGATWYDVSTEGTLLVKSDAPASSAFVWVGPDGTITEAPGRPVVDLMAGIALSPQEDRVAFVAGPRGSSNVFVRDLKTGVDTRITSGQPAFDASTWSETLYPQWFPSGDRLLYTAGPVEAFKVVARRADGSDQGAELAPGLFGRVAADGRSLLWLEDDRGHGRLRYARFDPDGTLSDARSLAATAAANVRWFDLSPDGTLLAYSAVEPNTQQNVYLTPFPDGAARWPVTTEGGTSPRFARDGRTLFFLSGTTIDGTPRGRLMAMSLERDPSLRLGNAVPRLVEEPGGPPLNGFDVARDGRLLMARRLPAPTGGPGHAVLVQNWPAAIRRR